ncbi:MAG: 1,4-dihydroxy-2-naphthoate octaprenyltransferase [Candidatus Njordarchaeales archaeon]
MSNERPVMPKWKALILASRPPFLQVTILPVSLGIILAFYHVGHINWLYAVLVLLIACFMHLSVNLVHEYWDWKSGTDNINVNAMRPFTGGSGMIQLGLVSPKEELAFGLSLLILATILGLYILVVLPVVRIPLLIIGAIAVFSIIFYTGPPLKLAHRGVGEFFIFLNFGPLMCLGSYIVLTQRIHMEPIIVGSLLGILTTAILWINEFPDVQADASVGKRHLVVRFGLKRARYGYAILEFLPYIIQILAVFLGLLPWITLITFLAIPQAIRNVRICFENYDKPKKLFPANLGTIKNHLIYGLLLILAYILIFVIPINPYLGS